MVYGIYKAHATMDDYVTKRLDDIDFPFGSSIDWLTTSMHEIKQDLAMLQKQHGVGARRSKSIDAHTQTSIDASIQVSIDARFTSFEDRLQSFTYRLDGICYPLHDSIDELISRLDALQQDMDMIDHGFDQLLHMVYKCFNYHLLYYRVYLVYL
ncbi:hypothetical protein YC2023_117091 [Brassica napus]